jgi:hypothetical protein
MYKFLRYSSITTRQFYLLLAVLIAFITVFSHAIPTTFFSLQSDTIMTSQPAIWVAEIGKPVVLGSKPIPKPKEGEVLVKVSVGSCK